MKSNFLVILGATVFVWLPQLGPAGKATAAPADAPVLDLPIDLSKSGGPKPKDSASPPVIVRGWQIISASAVKHAKIGDVVPNYNGNKANGNVTNNLLPTKGTFIILLVQCQSASGTDLQQPLWGGKPDVVLVDDNGFEYPALGKLVPQGGDYVAEGMVVRLNPRNSKHAPAAISNMLAYFDVPASSQAFWLRFAGAQQLVPVDLPKNLPSVVIQ
jgi:hypothetical protein